MRPFNRYNMNSDANNLGFSLVELMVSMTIGLILVIGATKIYVDGHASYVNNEAIARMQETARYAMSVLENDIRMANYWGESALASDVVINVPFNPPDNQEDCGKVFILPSATTTIAPFRATDNSYLPNPYDTSCAPRSGALPTGDTLTILRGGNTSTPGVWQVCTQWSQIELSSVPCAGTNYAGDFIFHTYYVDMQSDNSATVPSLRRHYFSQNGGAPVMQDEEVIPGVEDFQVEFGIDPNGSSSPTVYTAPVAPVPSNPTGIPTDPSGMPYTVLSVRIWLLIRADSPESGFVDDRAYVYAGRLLTNGTTGDLTSAADTGKAYQPSKSGDTSFTGPTHYRRMLVSKTILPRNACPFSAC